MTIYQLFTMVAATLMLLFYSARGATLRPTDSSPAGNGTTGASRGNHSTSTTTTPSSTHRQSTTSDDCARSRTRRWIEMVIGKLDTSAEQLSKRSVCAWTYSYNTDENRLPRTLIEAQCTKQQLNHLAGQCEHIYYYVPVRQNVSGTWTERWIWLRVGCTLATAISQRVPAITFE